MTLLIINMSFITDYFQCSISIVKQNIGFYSQTIHLTKKNKESTEIFLGKIIMASLYVHGKSFINRLIWLNSLMRGILPAVIYLIQARGKPMKIGHAFYNNVELEFRNCDSTALKEVLVDAEYNFLKEFLKSSLSPVIVDVGAHIGTFSLWVYYQNPKVKMLMVEANPTSHQILVRNIRKNFSAKQYKILNKAAWKNNDVLKFFTAGDSMGNRVSEKGDIKVSGVTFVEIVNMVIANNSSIDLMKIDIEGAEEAFFETADLVLDKVRRLVIELHPKYCNTESIIQKLERRYKHIREISSRIDSKPLLYCTDE